MKIALLLGNTNDTQGNLSPIAVARCNKALAFLAENPECQLIITGGFGDHFNTTDKPHYLYIKQYLLSNGLSESRMYACVDSFNTQQDIELGKVYISQFGATEVFIFTSTFHKQRVQAIAAIYLTDFNFDILTSEPSEYENENMETLLKHEAWSITRYLIPQTLNS